MAFSLKKWFNKSESHTTPLNAAAMNDIEKRVTDYSDTKASLENGKLLESQLPNSTVSSTQHWVSIVDCGAISGQDCTVAIEAAQKKALESGANYGVFFPAGTYIFSKTLLIEVPWLGVPRKSKLKQSAVEFTYTNGVWSVKNLHFTTFYNAGTANSVSVQGVDMIFHNLSTEERVGLAFGNVATGEITDCHLSTEGTNRITVLEVFAAGRNMVFNRVWGVNTTEASNGGCWIRNSCSPISKAAARENATENITINDCYFATSTGDEALAVFSAGGMVRHIRINRTKLEALPSSKKHNHIGSTVLVTGEGTYPYCAVEDVEWNACTFVDTTGNIKGESVPEVLVFGLASESGFTETVLQDIRNVNCKFVVSTATNATILANHPNTFEGLTSGNASINPTINTIGSSGALTGISGFPIVTTPTILGSAIVKGCSECGEVQGDEHIEASEAHCYKCSVVLPIKVIFGDGSDGRVTLDGSTEYAAFATRSGSIYTLTRDLFASILVIETGVTLKTTNCRIYATRSITNKGTIVNSGEAGNANGTPGFGNTTNSFGGASGGAGELTEGKKGTAISRYGTGGSGKGGTGSSGAGGVGQTPVFSTSWQFRDPIPILLGAAVWNVTITPIGATGGGGGGGGDGTVKGGGGGASGGVVAIFTRNLNNSGKIEAVGGNGGSPASGTGPGGGGGGAGGLIVAYTLVAVVNTGTISVAGGNGGAKQGTGENGAAGTEGNYLNVVLV